MVVVINKLNDYLACVLLTLQESTVCIAGLNCELASAVVICIDRTCGDVEYGRVYKI